MYVCMYMYICINVCICVCVCIYMYVCIYIGHINPVRQQLRESLSTLNFLSFTRTINTRPQVNASDALCGMCSLM